VHQGQAENKNATVCVVRDLHLMYSSFFHYHRTEFSWRPKTAKEYRKTAKEMFFGGAPPSMNRQVWIARKIEFPWRLALKQCFLDCQPAKKNMDM